MSTTGRLVSINISPGGVPKLPVAEARVTFAGLEGDWQTDRRYHGGPDRAVSIFSVDQIEALKAEGHPIDAGSTGENVSVEGISWPLVIPGCRMALGDEVEIEVTAFAPPCRTIRHSFSEEGFKRLSEKVYPGWSRVYSRVLREGVLRVGAAVRLR